MWVYEVDYSFEKKIQQIRYICCLTVCVRVVANVRVCEYK